MIAGKGPLAICGIAVLAVAIGAHGQDAAFAVASIKPNTSGLPYSQSTEPPNGVAFINERLRDVILFAFGRTEDDQPWTQATTITKIQPQRTRRTLRKKLL